MLQDIKELVESPFRAELVESLEALLLSCPACGSERMTPGLQITYRHGETSRLL
jgi:hypothetical protein